MCVSLRPFCWGIVIFLEDHNRLVGAASPRTSKANISHYLLSLHLVHSLHEALPTIILNAPLHLGTNPRRYGCSNADA